MIHYAYPRGEDLVYLQVGISGVFAGFFLCRQYIYSWVLVTAAVLFGVAKLCISKCLIVSTVFFWVQFYSPSKSVNTVLHHYHIVFNFC